MKILFTRFPLESRFGGAEVQTLALMKGLKEKGHEVAFLGSCPVLLQKIIGNREKVEVGPPPVSFLHAMTFLFRQFRIRKILTSTFSLLPSRFDAIVMLSLTEKILLTPLLHKQGIKTIWVEHDRVGPWLTRNPWLPRLRNLSKLAKTIVVSDLSKKIYEDLGFQNVVAIPNGIDTTRLASGKSQILPTGQAGINHKSQIFHIGTIARLSYDKGVDVLINAVKDLPGLSLTIVGTGPEQSSLQSAIRDLPHMTILPRVDDLGAFYRSLDLFILPSREHDPFGLVVGEAMMMGIPTIVTDACGIAGYLKNGHDTVIVPADSVVALRKAILDLKQDAMTHSTIGTIGKRTAEEIFSINGMVEHYESVLIKK